MKEALYERVFCKIAKAACLSDRYPSAEYSFYLVVLMQMVVGQRKPGDTPDTQYRAPAQHVGSATCTNVGKKQMGKVVCYVFRNKHDHVVC